MMGDLNARCATPDNKYKHQHIRNPDNVRNGRNMMFLSVKNELVIVNRLKYCDNQFDTNFTYHQNDWCVRNHNESVKSFEILEKLSITILVVKRSSTDQQFHLS